MQRNSKCIEEIYMECGDFKKAISLSGLPFHIAYYRLIKSGILKIEDKIEYGSHNHRVGGMAEELFEKIIPDAINANKMYKKIILCMILYIKILP